MMFALAWLTISLPYVYEAQQNIYKIADNSSTKKTAHNPLTNTTEEKTPSVNSLSEEYLHGHEEPLHFFATEIIHNNAEFIDLYIAFHGELISPPPEA